MAQPAHDAFLSYSQSADGRLAAALEVGLEKLAKPLFRLRAIDVFRDRTGLSASPGLWASIAGHLEASRWLVFFASPASAASPWCAKELLWWLDRHGSERLLIVLTEGALVWNAGGGGPDAARTDALPAAALARLPEEPLWVDLRWARGEERIAPRDPRLRPALLDLAAPIRGIAKDVLDGEDVRQQRRTRRIAVAAAAAIVAGAGVATWQAIEATRQRDAAERLRELALARQLAAQSAALLVRNPVLALQLAAESHAVAPTIDGRSALLGAVTALPLSRLQQHEAAWWSLAVAPRGDALLLADSRGAVYRGRVDDASLQTVTAPAAGLALFRAVDALAFSADGKHWAEAGSSGEIAVHAGSEVKRFASGDKVGEMNPSLRVLALAFDPGGQRLVSASSSGRLVVHDLIDGTSRVVASADLDLTAVAFSPDGRWLVAGGDQGFLKAFAVDPGATPPAFAGTGRSAVQSLAFDATGQRLFAASRTGRIEMFDSAGGQRTAALDAPQHGALERMAVSPDGRFLATGHATGEVVLWLRTADDAGWPSRTLLRHAAAVRGLAFAADGRRLLSAGADGRLFVSLPVDRGRWTASDAPVPAASPSPLLSASAARATSPDGRWIAKASGPGSAEDAFRIDLGGLSLTRTARLTVLRASDGTPVAENAELPVEPGERSVGAPIFAADSHTIALQIADRVLLWDVASGRALDAAIPLPPGGTLAGADAARAGWLARVGNAGYAFDTTPDAWRDSACRLAGGPIPADRWTRHLGDGRPYMPACR